MLLAVKRLANYFLQGLVFLVPITITIYALVATFRTLDGLLGLPTPGLGLLILIVLVTLIGFLLSNYLTRRFLSIFEAALERLPFAKLLHASIKDLLNAFVGEKRRFDRPVLVDLDPGGVRAVGFVTRASLEQFALPDYVAVYFPQAYNFSGHLGIVSKNRITPIQADSAEVLAFIVSGGVAGKK